MFKTIRWRIAVPYITLILLAMAGLTLYLAGFVRDLYVEGLRAQLGAEVALVGDALRPLLSREVTGEELAPLVRYYGELLDARVTVIQLDGTVLGDSFEDWRQMDNHADRPEVIQAMANGSGSSIRFSQTVGYEMMYVAGLVLSEGRPVGVIRVALPLRQITSHAAHLRVSILVATLITVSLALLLAVLIAERIAQPIRELKAAVERMREGDLGARFFPTTRDEVGSLAEAFNQMAMRLASTVETLSKERVRLGAILEHMGDGVLITDNEGRVRLINQAAARILSTTEEQAIGRSFAQVARDHRLIELWRHCLQRKEEQFEAVEMDRKGPFLQVIATPIQDVDGPACLVILQDLTRVRQLESVRRDFISNISHELRTPLASLKALVETLRDGALGDPPAAQRFLDRIETEVDSMTQMVQELLELSRIESGRVPFRMAPVSVTEIVVPAVERLRAQAERAGLKVEVALPAELPHVLADVERAWQVVGNLVHNAIKFTPAGGTVSISAEPSGDEVIISVQDTGVGIPADDLPRVFERFFKSERSRSGGGTGLGLAIAQHIVHGHGGRIWVKSVEGQGSTFSFSLPIAK